MESRLRKELINADGAAEQAKRRKYIRSTTLNGKNDRGSHFFTRNLLGDGNETGIESGGAW